MFGNRHKIGETESYGPKRIPVRKLFFSILRDWRAMVSVYSVPAAAGLVGWICGGRLVLWAVENPPADFHLEFLVSSPMFYATRICVAVLLFVLTNRYLN